MKAKNILAVETSCDETSVAVVSDGLVKSNVIYTQKVHEKYGGVVPEIASRAHLEKIVPVYQEALGRAGLGLDDLDAIGYTDSPGLIGSLLVGASFAKSLAQALDKPIIPINHIEAHAIANAIDSDIAFPFLCLIVSGGHTEFRICHSHVHTEVLGCTRDDAVGEAFDKIAKMLALDYPGGPQISKQAMQGSPDRFRFPISEVPGLDFSFSGIKTSVMYFLQKNVQKNPDFIDQNLADICASVQKNLVDTLLEKFRLAISQTGIQHISIAGGVSANAELRIRFADMASELGCSAYIPELQYCTDNAAMIAYAAYHKFLENPEGYSYFTVPSARIH